MIFKKLRVKKIQIDKFVENTSWVLYIDNLKDLTTYLLHDTKMFTRTLFTMGRDDNNNIKTDHLSTIRERVLACVIETKNMVGERALPLEVVNEIINEKHTVMSKAISELGAIQINNLGGWSGVKPYNDLYEVEVLAEIHKDHVEFPIDEEPKPVQLLILENGKVGDNNELLNKLSNLNFTNSFTIYNLKDTDITWVTKNISLAEIIAFETQAVDLSQIDQFMQLFYSLPKSKVLYIKTNNKTDITSHKLFSENEKKHSINFI